ncbi:MOP flippase family protein [Vibrio maritimus]|uniref:MOP flippase family protein n=1 Tax=Vibrio maritimus TaxID=990268 RepID=UPI003735DF0B
MTLKTRALSGVKWTSISMLICTAAQLLQLAVLARLLEPEEFGIMAIMMIVIGFSQAFMDMGISNAIIHRQEISHSQLSSLYWLNIAAGVVLTIIVFFIAPFVSAYYEQPNLTQPLMLLSLVFFAVSLGNQYKVLFQKNLQFNTIAVVDMTAAVIALGVAVLSALNGMGVYALVLGMLTQSFISSASYLALGIGQHHRPSFSYKHSELEGFFSFGLYQMGERSINYLSANVDKLIIGKVLGMTSVGFYNMAWQLIIFPLSKINPVVNNVAFPVFASIQKDTEALDRYYSLTIKTITLVTIPLLAFICVYASDVVLFAFGEGWNKTAELVSVLAVVGILKAFANPGGSLLIALGHAKVGFWWNLFWASFIVAGVYLALHIEADVCSVPMSLLALSLTVGWIWHVLIVRYCGITYASILRHFVKLIIVGFSIAFLAQYLMSLFEIELVVLRLLLSGALCLSLYVPYVVFFEKEIISKFRSGNR